MSRKQIVTNALQGNVPQIPFIQIRNPNGQIVFFGKEDGIWTNKELLSQECTITSGYDYLVCWLHNKWKW